MENDNLILQSLSGRRLSAAELIGVTQIPSSTLYKRLARLKDDGLIEVHTDPHDGRLKLYTLREAPRPAVRRRNDAAPALPQAAPTEPQSSGLQISDAQPSEPGRAGMTQFPAVGQTEPLADDAPETSRPDRVTPQAAPGTAVAQGVVQGVESAPPVSSGPVSSGPVSSETVSPETVSPETVSPEPVSPGPVSPEPAPPASEPGAPAADGPRALGDAELDELAELLQRVDRLGLYQVPEYDALRRLLAREQAVRGLRHSRAYV